MYLYVTITHFIQNGKIFMNIYDIANDGCDTGEYFPINNRKQNLEYLL